MAIEIFSQKAKKFVRKGDLAPPAPLAAWNQHFIKFIGPLDEGRPWNSLALRIHSTPLVRSTFCPMKIDHISGLTLYPGYWLV